MLKYNRYKNNDIKTRLPRQLARPPPIKDFGAELYFAIHRIMINIALFIYILYRNRNCSVIY